MIEISDKTLPNYNIIEIIDKPIYGKRRLMNFLKAILMLSSFLLSVQAFSQTATINGCVKGIDGIVIPGVIVFIDSITNCNACNKSCTSDNNGLFKLIVQPGKHRLTTSMLGYKSLSKTITVKQNEVLFTTIVLNENTKQLQDVEVIAKTNVEEQKEKPGNISAINTKEFYNSTQGLNEVLKKTSGIKIRQSGGYGSGSEFFLNGVSGKQIKFFIDGIPADNLGTTQGINIIPVEQTERIDIYKGAVPIDLGSDALGGAINIITRNERKDYLDVSTSYGSFSTTKNSLNFKKYFGKYFYTSFAGSYNYTLNNYKVDAEHTDEQGQITIKPTERFHNTFIYQNAKAEVGFVNTKWCNKFSIQGSYATTYDEIQHNVIMRQAYGKVNYSEKLIGTTIKYQKFNLLKNLHVTAFANYNKVKSLFVDTTLSIYLWDGSIAPYKRNKGGEISSIGSLMTTKAEVLNSKVALSYTPFDFLKISLANTSQYFYRKGNDPFSLNFYGFDYYQFPQKMLKNIGGLAAETKLFKGKLLNTTSFKYYFSSFSGHKLEDLIATPVSKKLHFSGYNTAFTYFIIKPLFLKASYEQAVRLPDETELFGDLMLTKPNLSLLPEISDNVNGSIVLHTRYIDAEATYFYRNVGNIIYLQTSQFGTQYQNLLKSETQGIEGAIKLKPFECLSIDGNITYQNLRNKSEAFNSGVKSDRYYNARLPNIPYFFCNGGTNFHLDSILKKKFAMQVYYNVSYVNEYYLYWAVDGDKSLKNFVPYQFVNSTGISLNHHQTGLSVSFEVSNLMNEKVYDNFKVQLPGRA